VADCSQDIYNSDCTQRQHTCRKCVFKRARRHGTHCVFYLRVFVVADVFAKLPCVQYVYSEIYPSASEYTGKLVYSAQPRTQKRTQQIEKNILDLAENCGILCQP
jgi:hypothetical protein